MWAEQAGEPAGGHEEQERAPANSALPPSTPPSIPAPLTALAHLACSFSTSFALRPQITTSWQPAPMYCRCKGARTAVSGRADETGARRQAAGLSLTYHPSNYN